MVPADGSHRGSSGATRDQFDIFLSLLTKHQSAGTWRFVPGAVDASVGQTLSVVNHGGGVHTFTELEACGGGAVRNGGD